MINSLRQSTRSSDGDAGKSSMRAKAFLKALRKNKHHKADDLKFSPLQMAKKKLRKSVKYYNRRRHELKAPIFFILWLIWLFVGSLFYAYAPKSNLGFYKGFYMALNIGYSIGFGYPSEESNNYLFFSSTYVLIGASFVGVALGFFADQIAKDNGTWFTRLEQQQKIEKAILEKKTWIRGHVQRFLYHCSSAIRALAVWLAFVIAMIVYSIALFGWPFREAQYFAISALSTGGHWSIPNDSPDWVFGLTGLFLMFGVPLMAVAMAQSAFVFVSNVDIDEAKATIDATVTKEELVFLQDLGLEDFDGEVDKAQFIILCMVRTGTDPGLIKYITQRFAELNFYTGQALTISEITQGACRFVNGQVRRSESVKRLVLETVTEHDAAVVTDEDGSSGSSDELLDSFCLEDCEFGTRSSGARSSIRNQPTTFKSRIPFADEEALLEQEIVMAPPESKRDNELDTTHSRVSESSFLTQLVEKLGLQKTTRYRTSDVTDLTTDTFLDELESGNGSTGSSSFSGFKRFVDDLKEECRSLASQDGSAAKDSKDAALADSGGVLGGQQQPNTTDSPNDQSADTYNNHIMPESSVDQGHSRLSHSSNGRIETNHLDVAAADERCSSETSSSAQKDPYEPGVK